MDIMTTVNGNELVKHGLVPIKNSKLLQLKVDHLYHIALDTEQHDLQTMFGDVKFVCFGGQVSRMERFTSFVIHELGLQPGTGDTPTNYAAGTDRYALYKAGPVLAVSHGIGIPSLSVVFNEILKLVHYAKCTDVTFFRIGTCGGVGLEPGTVVLTEKAVDGAFQPFLSTTILGKKVQRPAYVEKPLLEELLSCSENTDDFKTVTGITMCTDDFYEGQARLDGAFCDFDEEDKMKFLNNVKANGVCNIEMESLGFLAMCNHAGVPGAVACVTLLDRLKGDFVSTDFNLLKSWQHRAQTIVLRFIKQRLTQQNRHKNG